MEKLRKIIHSNFITQKAAPMPRLDTCYINGVNVEYDQLPRHAALSAYCHIAVIELGIDDKKTAEFLDIPVSKVRKAIGLSISLLESQKYSERYKRKIDFINNALIEQKIKR